MYVFDPNVGWDTDYLDRDFSCFFSVLPSEFLDSTLKQVSISSTETL
jgi:hypothetical protein